MRISEIQIINFRGIIDFKASFNNESSVVTGANGTGKSGVIDAIDFLLAGRISRLDGGGTKELSLDDHGRHIDKAIETSLVRATINLESGKSLTIERNLKDKKLKKTAGEKPDFESLSSLITSGQFVLSRRELLKFITCDGSTRSQQVQALLNLEAVEKVRKDFGTVINKLETDEGVLESTETNRLSAIDQKLDNQSGPPEKRISKLNELRAYLKADPIEDLFAAGEILKGIEPITQDTQNLLTRKTVEDLRDSLSLDLINSPAINNVDVFNSFLTLLSKIANTQNLEQKIKDLEFLEAGILRSSNADACPLCDLPWENIKLVNHLKQKKEAAAEASSLKQEFLKISSIYISQIEGHLSKISSLKLMLQKADVPELLAKVSSWEIALKEKKTLFQNVSNAKDIFIGLQKDAKFQVSCDERTAALLGLDETIKSLPEASIEENSYLKLVAISNFASEVEELRKRIDQAKNKLSYANIAKHEFDKARENIISDLYNSIEHDFIEYYRHLNSDDEIKFSAKLQDLGAKLDLKVDFHNRGLYPPNALHSEGHQDGMGICLYLALMKKLKGPSFTLALLDDVMMSIDTGHRKQLCALLKQQFPDTQFIITTHDPAWAKQLRAIDLVPSKNIFYFRNWTPEFGPTVDNKDKWVEMLDKANSGDIISASAILRNTLEAEFQEICEDLRGSVVYRGAHNWSLEEFKNAAIGAYKKWLKEAKNCAISWKNKDQELKIDSLLVDFSKAHTLSNVESWEINPAVHYNNWAIFSKEEIKSTIEAMKNFVDEFKCKQCKTPLYLTGAKMESPDIIGCHCGSLHFTLKRKEK